MRVGRQGTGAEKKSPSDACSSRKARLHSGNSPKRWKSIDDVTIKLIKGKFEEHIADVRSFVGRSFSLVFIDPTGWTGFPLEKITPLLQLKGEVMINFMSDFITRFIDDPLPEHRAGL